MAYKTVIDCTNDVNIRHFLQSDKCSDIRLQPVFVDDIRYLDKYLSETDPIAVILSTNILSVSDMYNLITSQFSQRRYILCIGQIRNRKDKRNLKVLQEEYNCSIIENVVTDLILMNHIIDCIVASGGVEFIGTNVLHEHKYVSESVQSEHAKDFVQDSVPTSDVDTDLGAEDMGDTENPNDIEFDNNSNVPSNNMDLNDDEDDVSFD